MNRKEPWEGYRRQAKRVLPVVSFPLSFARTFSSKERRLGTRQGKKCTEKCDARAKLLFSLFTFFFFVFVFFDVPVVVRAVGS